MSITAPARRRSQSDRGPAPPRPACRCSVAEEGQQLVDHGARALSGRNLTEGLCRRGPHVGVPVAKERQQLVDDGARALEGTNSARPQSAWVLIAPRIEVGSAAAASKPRTIQSGGGWWALNGP